MSESCYWCGNEYDVDEMYEFDDYDENGEIGYYLICPECNED